MIHKALSQLPAYMKVTDMHLIGIKAIDLLGQIYQFISIWIQDGTADISGSDELTAVRASFNTWENDYFSGIDYYDNGTSLHFTWSQFYVQNIGNRLGWDILPSDFANALGITYHWDTSDSGFYRLTEVHTLLNDNFTWCIGQVSGQHDVQNIATHEIGHWLRLQDLYASGNSEQTMYWSSSSGEIKKRSLEYGDINGAHYLYPIENDAGTDGDASNTFSGANTVSISYTYKGRLCYYPSHTDTQDYYKVTVGSTYRLAFRMVPPSWANFDLELYYPNGTLADYSRNTGNGVQEIITKDPMGVTGDWRIRVYASSVPIVGNGNYTFSITNLPQFVQTQEQEEVE